MHWATFWRRRPPSSPPRTCPTNYRHSHLVVLPVLVGYLFLFIILSSVINLFIGSASAKWAIMAPIFVPMFMLLGYNPALIQMAYRIGDSITNPLSPLFPYFPILIAVARKYDKKAGLGTLISNMIPYSLFFGIVWTLLLILFIIFNIPLGPGAGIHYSF